MSKYKEMYYKLFNAITDADRIIDECVDALENPSLFAVKEVRSALRKVQINIVLTQEATEEMYIDGK